MITVAIIGGGPAGLAVCMQLKKQLMDNGFKAEIEILVFEKKSQIGPGLAYSTPEESHILNLPKAVMEPVFGETNQFSLWLNKESKRDIETNYPSRRHFGAYLEQTALETQKEAQEQGLNIFYYTRHNILDLQYIDDNKFNIISSEGTYVADYVVLCSGHMPSETYTECIGQQNYIHNPWDENAFKNIKPEHRVGIIGTRLTAIDVALTLKKGMNHQNKIVMASRSGLLPTVLSSSMKKYEPQRLNKDKILANNNKKPFAMSYYAALFLAEVAENAGNTHLRSVPTSSKDISPLEWMEHEISEAESGERGWQQALFALYPLTPLIWTRLTKEDQDIFLKHYNSLFMTYLAAFPLENAYKIRDMLVSKSLEVRGQLSHVSFNNNTAVMIFEDGSEVPVDFIINATGPGYDPTMIPLFKNMLEHGLISRHYLGGIRIEKDTLEIIDRNDQKNPNLFAIGELTKGDYFLTADLAISTAQAQTVATLLVDRLRNAYDCVDRPKPF